MFLLGTAAFTLVAFGLLPKLFVTEYGVQIGSALEMILLSFALAYRYADLRNENERLVQVANEELENKVAERTLELRGAMDRLAEVNRRDGLTGVFNRHHFRELLERQLCEARDGHKHLAVLMVDLDHFKRINDQLGHLAGDACIRSVARTMEETLAPYRGIVARFGGEEFVAVLPDLSPAAALRAAEALRQAIAEQEVMADGTPVHLTASIGVHALDAYRVDDPEAALRAADEALYSAKEQGRNCVRPVLAPETAQSPADG
jgi:diguanylate cyclase (GGDEF)-like protein